MPCEERRFGEWASGIIPLHLLNTSFHSSQALTRSQDTEPLSHPAQRPRTPSCPQCNKGTDRNNCKADSTRHLGTHSTAHPRCPGYHWNSGLRAGPWLLLQAPGVLSEGPTWSFPRLPPPQANLLGPLNSPPSPTNPANPASSHRILPIFQTHSQWPPT